MKLSLLWAATLLFPGTMARGQAVIGISGVQLLTGPVIARLSVTGLVGTAGSVQFTTELSQSNSWTTLTNFTLSSNPLEVADNGAAAAGRRFYRLSQTTPPNPDPATIVWIPPGSFVMGSPLSEAGRMSDETQHNVHDMHGNLCQWCQDWYGAYPSGSVTNPPGPASGAARVYRGGSWRGYGDNCRAAARYSSYVPGNYSVIGFRVVLAAVQP